MIFSHNTLLKEQLELRSPSSTVSFADVAHQTLLFDKEVESSRLILELIDTRWVQRLRSVRQTGNTNLVYMFSEHSRFGHSLGVAYLAHMLMTNLERHSFEDVRPYKNAVAAAALLHDIGHVAPGSHLAEKIWGENRGKHEVVTARVIKEDSEIAKILASYGTNLQEQVVEILTGGKQLPSLDFGNYLWWRLECRSRKLGNSR